MFYQDYAHFQDTRHRVEALFDRALLPLDWDPTWNQWRHLLSAEISLEAEFTQYAKWKRSQGRLEQTHWERPLSSRIQLTVPHVIHQQIREARHRFHQLGQLAELIQQVRARLDREPIEEADLRSLFRDVGYAEDFDPSLINWQATYDRFFYDELRRRKRRLYLFRNEYIFETSAALVVEIPSAGHATYLFAVPRKLEDFLCCYSGTSKEAIRTNRDGIAEQLGFVARVIHGSSRNRWLRALRKHLGEPAGSGSGTEGS